MRGAPVLTTLLAFLMGIIFGAVFFALYNPKIIIAERAKATQHGNDEESKEIGSIVATVSAIQTAEQELSTVMYNKVRVLCWIMTHSKAKDRQDAIVDTWGSRCNMLLFIEGGGSNITAHRKEELFKTVHKIELYMKESYENLWEKTKLAFRYIHENYKDQFDWIFKVDDDSYVIMENLRLFVNSKSQEDPHFYGCQYQALGGYNSGGPGYVMSALNLNKLIQSFSMPQCSQGSAGAEDVEVANCLRLVGISPGDSRDAQRFRFSPFKLENTMFHETLHSRYNWFWGFTAHKLQKGFECCSDEHISFHYIEPNEMRIMELSIYYFHPFSKRDGWRRPLEKS
uniref:N-acetylgalactosaminide beta-1,3-galactosyltransferase n=1 Tax=Plectus sambesii TaxID=2011161 RepID=A0A914WEK5_9BILA